MANYRLDKGIALASTMAPAIVATGEAADGEVVFTEFQHAKAAALQRIDEEFARLKNRRAVIRSMRAKDVKLEAE